MVLLEDRGRDYRRYRHSAEERLALGRRGLTPVLSSNVSAVGIDNEDLLIRFHNGSLYRYYGMAESYEDIMMSNSKGKWVWANLRRKNVPYSKTTLPLQQDVLIDDEQIISVGNRFKTINDLPTVRNFDKIKPDTRFTVLVERLRAIKVLARTQLKVVDTSKYTYLS